MQAGQGGAKLGHFCMMGQTHLKACKRWERRGGSKLGESEASGECRRETAWEGPARSGVAGGKSGGRRRRQLQLRRQQLRRRRRRQAPAVAPEAAAHLAIGPHGGRVGC